MILVGFVYVPLFAISYCLCVFACDRYSICIRFSIICINTLLL